MHRWLVTSLLCASAFACEATNPSLGQPDNDSDGTGVEPHPEPYDVPEEATRLLNGAVAGIVSPPSLHESSIYPGLRFQYWLYTPADYVDDRPVALMVFQDGGTNYLDVFRTPMVLDNLIQAGDIPPAIALFINPGTPSGVFDWEADDELSSDQYDSIDDRYAHFLLDELLPDVVLSNYNIVEDPDGWAVIGFSSGGIAAFTVAWHHPDRFRKVLTQNGSFVDIRGGGVYPDLIRTAPVKPLRVYLLSGTDDLRLPAGSWLEAKNAMAAALEDRGYAFRYRPGSGHHYPPDQAVSDFPNALRWLWREYSLPR